MKHFKKLYNWVMEKLKHADMSNETEEEYLDRQW